ncbi:hypothetical protein, partial [Sporosarcina sp. P1]|uniref:hypothetical protein n=1 Tax=Sporosarcina sp. P1 TaxID=2048257 RepID=UPI001E5ABBDF
YHLFLASEVYELSYTLSNEGACCGRRSKETETGALPVCGSLRKPSSSAAVGAMSITLTLLAKPHTPNRNVIQQHYFHLKQRSKLPHTS